MYLLLHDVHPNDLWWLIKKRLKRQLVLSVFWEVLILLARAIITFTNWRFAVANINLSCIYPVIKKRSSKMLQLQIYLPRCRRRHLYLPVLTFASLSGTLFLVLLYVLHRSTVAWVCWSMCEWVWCVDVVLFQEISGVRFRCVSSNYFMRKCAV